MNTFAHLLDGMSEFEELSEKLSSGETLLHAVGVSGSQKSQLIYSLGCRTGKKCLVVAADETEAGRIVKDLSFLCSRAPVYFPPREYIFYDIDASNRKGEHERIRSLYEMEDADFVVTTITALSSYTLPKELFLKYTIRIDLQSSVDMEKLISDLIFMGYKRVSTVEGIGQFSVRGSIIDVFPPSEKVPYRIELWGDEVDSVRTFNPATQLSEVRCDRAAISPTRELLYTDDDVGGICKIIKSSKNENLLRDAEKFASAHYFASADKYMPYFYSELPSVTDYLGDCMIFADDAAGLNSKLSVWYKEQNEIISELMEKGLFPRIKGKYFDDWNDFAKILSDRPSVTVSTLMHNIPDILPKAIVSFSSKTLQAYSADAEYMIDDIVFWKSRGYRIVAALASESKVKSLCELLANKGITVSVGDGSRLPEYGEVYAVVGSVERGYEFPSAKTVVVTDGEEIKRKKRRRKPTNAKDAIKSFDEISIGDYVVHTTHGIGQYVGIERLEVQKVVRDYIKLKYHGSDCLYVPVEQLGMLYKYSGTEEDKTVRLNSLGGAKWAKTVSRVKHSVAELAEGMIKLYAQRSSAEGHVFQKDSDWQIQFENDFAYDETEDQLRCIAEVKSDMENGKCMDRLLCGDVGYGKTEVALRAAFKCVMEGMQVAYLVPTTILAQQHYNTFVSRMKEYCINVEMLSRFRTKKQQQEIIEKLKTGEVDVVIGTHRLIQKDVKFKSLGMLIIDEEQRFGVSHKERLKEIKKDVDVLTLSATPIPRTLNMAMIGIRDLSVITAPPVDRYPVQTFVAEYNAQIVKNAIEREMARSGQVYYLYNRIDGIDRIAERLRALVPDANIAVAHGRMSEVQLENIMLDLLSGDIDVLVCTTIIETGLDVPNANTIIIEDADRLGLSQLYQLKGRVGRSNRLAYAYFTYREGKVLDSVAQKRLGAIREFTEFGSGFKIAMRDLEIRGAGNLLGKEQHGNMNLVGYDMYCRLLEEAVKELKGEEYVPKTDTSLDIKVSAYIPDDVVADEKARIEMYRKIAGIETDTDREEVEAEFIDRYGDIPQCTHDLMRLAEIRSTASGLGISDISQKDGMIVFTLTREPEAQKLIELIDKYKGKIMYSSGSVSYLSWEIDGDILGNIKIILQTLKKTIQETQL